MPIKVLQYNERVVEVQFVCDFCGKLVRTSLISRKEVDAQKNIDVTCWQYKQTTSTNQKS